MNTKENKERLFAQYYMQEVLVDGVGGVRLLDKTWNWKHKSFYLLLKPLSSITNEDAINVGCKSSEHVPENRVWSQPNIDYLRSKGYALPYLEISVEDQIKYGWVKLDHR